MQMSKIFTLIVLNIDFLNIDLLTSTFMGIVEYELLLIWH